MAFKFINTSSSGSYQTLFNRLIEDPDTINLTNDTPGINSNQSIPFDGIDDSMQLNNIVLTQDIGASGLSASNISFDAFLKITITGGQRWTFFDASIMRSESAIASGFDGIYIGSIALSADGNYYPEFRMYHNSPLNSEYSLTADRYISTGEWNHVMCSYASGAQTMSIYTNMSDTSLSSATISSLSQIATPPPLGARGISFGGRLDEIRLWLATGSATSVGKLASTTSIGLAPEDLTPALNHFTPSASLLAAWWRFETVSAIQLFSAVSASLTDATPWGHHATPSGFDGSDIISSETTIINGLSASGDLVNLLGGTLDHGGLCVLDPQDNTVRLENGSENLITNIHNIWTVSGGGTIISVDNNNIFYGSSGVKINTVSADRGAYMDVSNSSILYSNNYYNMSVRYRSVSGSTSARFSFILGNSTTSITGVTNTNTWKPIVLKHRMPSGMSGNSLSGRIIVTQLNAQNNEGSLFQLDGLQVIEGEYENSFVGPSRIRKSSQLVWSIYD